jgi:ubiquinone/menaquinone biosynthesis C-methylase UbiE
MGTYQYVERKLSVGSTVGPEKETVADAFTAISGTFDETFEASPIIHRIRSRVYGLITESVPAGGRILDISCGTGIDAIQLARYGFIVDGIDISPGMVERARLKAHSENMTNVSFRVASFEHLTAFPDQLYECVFSNFGGLNCVEDLGNVALEASRVAKPGAWFIGVVMPNVSLWEIISGMARLKFRYAFRRLGKVTAATGFGRHSFSVYYHSPRSVASRFKAWFEVSNIIGLSIFSPPPSAQSFLRRHPKFTALLERVDSAVESLPPFRSIGDHFIIIMKRKS